MTTSKSRDAERLAESLSQLPPMPQVAGKVLEMLESSTVTADRLRQTIEADPALAAAVLRLANSAMFSLPEQVTRVSHAVTLIGFLRLRSLTLTTVLAGLKHTIPQQVAEYRDAIWEHSVNVALAAKAFAKELAPTWTEEAFVCGLLHDCGRLALLVTRTEDYAALMRGGELPTIAAERERLGFDHAELGMALLTQWGLGEPVTTCVEAHHDDAAFDRPFGELVALVTLADRSMCPAVEGEALRPAGLFGCAEDMLEPLTEDVKLSVQEMRGELLSM